MRVAGALLLVAASTAGCAVRTPTASPPVPPVVQPLVDVTALIGPGCFTCLEAAFEAARPVPAARAQVALLLALRSKELGLPFERWIDDASGSVPLATEWQMYLDIVASVRVDPLSGDREAIMKATQLQRRQTATVLEWRAALAGGDASPLFRAYLDLTLACSLGDEVRAQAIANAEERFGDVPLVQYRIGTCRSISNLVALRAARPDFVDAELPLGRNALDSDHPDQEEALRRFAEAAQAFPTSPVIHASIGAVRQDREEWAEALEAYDATLLLVPTHRDALLGRTVALSNLERHQEAIQSAARLLELGDWFIGGAHFWRGWNEYNLGNLEAARTSLDQARARGAGAATLALSGLVAWRQRQLDLAESEFQEALRVDAGQCESAAFLGGVQTARQRLDDAVSALQHAQQCFDLRIALRRSLIDEINAGPGTPAGKAGQIERHERAIAESERNRDEARQSQAALRSRLP